MVAIVKSAINSIVRISKNKQAQARMRYSSMLEKKLQLDPRVVLLQSFDGKRFGGNPFYILRAMRVDSRFSGCRFNVAVLEQFVEGTRNLLMSYGMDDVNVVAIHSNCYLRLLATAQYLVNNSTFPTYFIKQSGQIYLNTWHGTPLKCMGRKMVDGPHTLGNTQRNFLMADYLLQPSKYAFDCFREDYMIGPIFSGKYVLAGYPCNSVFYDSSRQDEIRSALGLEGKKVVVYMPTWRSSESDEGARMHDAMQKDLLYCIESSVDSRTVCFVSPHYYTSENFGMDLTSEGRVRQFPSDVESYELLSVADLLITDYSSVMFDYLNSGKEIVLFSYDKLEYAKSRGCYFSVDELPFKQFSEPLDLARYVATAVGADFDNGCYLGLKERFCFYDSEMSPSVSCDLLCGIASEGCVIISGSSFHNGLANHLIFPGALMKNGITTAYKGLIESVDPHEFNWFTVFYAKNGNEHPHEIRGIPRETYYIPIQGASCATFSEAVARFLYYRFNLVNDWISEKIVSANKREAQRLFPGLSFESAVHFAGYEKKIVHLIAETDAKRRVMFVHNDMVSEGSTRNNYHLPSIAKAYSTFDVIAVVRESLTSVISTHFDVPREKIKVVHNCNRINSIRDMANAELKFDEDTESSIDKDSLSALLNDSHIKCLVNIARFSPEKGQIRLINAFEQASKRHPECALIIIGGHGSDYEMVLNAARSSSANIVVIKSVSNPFPILKKCDAFVLSSLYEGLPMTIMESLILNVPVICTKIDGPMQFLDDNKCGYLVDDSEEGIRVGLDTFLSGNFPACEAFDFDAFNQKALNEFMSAINA